MTPGRIAAAVVLVLASALGAASAAVAAVPMHAQLVTTTPGDGATVRTTAKVVLTFSEDINPKFIEMRVDGPGGDEADGQPSGDGARVTQPLVVPLPAGEHTVTYRVVSDDGHPVSGSFTFTSTRSAARATPTATPSSTPTTEAPPTTAAATPTPSPSSTPSPSVVPASTTSDGAPGWLVPALVGLIAVVLLAGGFLLSRRRPGQEEDPPA